MILWILILFVYLVYKWSSKNFDYFAKAGVPFEKPVPLFGNLLSVILQRESVIDLIHRNYNNFKGSKIFGFFNFSQVTYVLTDAEVIKRITIKDFDHFVNHNEMLDNIDRIFSKTLFGMHGQKWKDMRSILSPMFTSSKMRMMYGLLSSKASAFITHFEKKVGNSDIDVLEIFSRFTADGIATAALGFEGDCVTNEDSSIYKMVKKIIHEFGGSSQSIFKILIAFMIPKVYNLFGMQLVSKDTFNFFQHVVVDVMKERDQKNISRPDVIQLMLEVKKGQLQKENEDANDKELDGFAAHEELSLKSNVNNRKEIIDDDEYWIAQGFIFFFAGFDTTSNLLQSITFHLSKNPDVQEKLYQEISEVAATLNNKPITYETLLKMKYLDMLVSEGLRFQPPAPQIDRQCTKDYQLDLGNGKTVSVKKGDILMLPFYSLHHDANYFPNPEKFDPSRFSSENKDSIVVGSYLPFGLGPRACIGSRFALMEAKLMLFNVVANFKIETSSRTPEKLTYQPNMSQRIKETVYLNFKRRQ